MLKTIVAIALLALVSPIILELVENKRESWFSGPWPTED
jgi:hypothetical protein